MSILHDMTCIGHARTLLMFMHVMFSTTSIIHDRMNCTTCSVGRQRRSSSPSPILTITITYLIVRGGQQSVQPPTDPVRINNQSKKMMMKMKKMASHHEMK